MSSDVTSQTVLEVSNLSTWFYTRRGIVKAVNGVDFVITNETTGYNEDPTWSPDGMMIAFWSDRGGDHEIWAMLADGSGLVNVSNTPGADENPSWGP